MTQVTAAVLVHVWHYATHSVVVRLDSISGEGGLQQMRGDDGCTSCRTPHEHYADGGCFLRYTDMYLQREHVQRDVTDLVETEGMLARSFGHRREVSVTVHHDHAAVPAPPSNATLYFPHAAHSHPGHVACQGSSAIHAGSCPDTTERHGRTMRVKLAYDNTMTDVSAVTSLVFGELVKLATPVLKSFHSDLYHDALFLAQHCKGERWMFWYAFNASGTQVALNADLITREHAYRVTVRVVKGSASMDIIPAVKAVANNA